MWGSIPAKGLKNCFLFFHSLVVNCHGKLIAYSVSSAACTKCGMRYYCEKPKMSLSVGLLARLLGMGRALLKTCSDQTWRISLRLCIVLCRSKIYSTVIEFSFRLWNRIRIADYFSVLMLSQV